MENIRTERLLGFPVVGAMNYVNTLVGRFWQIPGELQSYLNFLLCEIDPLFSQKRMASEIVGIEHQTEESSTFVLRPPARWKGFRAGQFIAVEIDIAGARFRRNYSLSCSPTSYAENGTISITVKRVDGGRVSQFLNQSLRVSDVVHISQAMGQFTLPEDKIDAGSLLFIAGGSGITPIKSMIDQLVADGLLAKRNAEASEKGSVILIHHARNAEDIIFERHFARLAKRYQLTYITHFSDQEGRTTLEQFCNDCADLKQRSIYVCGPEGLMSSVREFSQSLSIPEDKLHSESFGNGVSVISDSTAISGYINFEFAQKQVVSDGKHTLLELAETAGLNPKYGCRNGICHECKCQRPQGHLMNKLTGQLIAEDQTSIQSCISVPVGDLTLSQW